MRTVTVIAGKQVIAYRADDGDTFLGVLRLKKPFRVLSPEAAGRKVQWEVVDSGGFHVALCPSQDLAEILQTALNAFETI